MANIYQRIMGHPLIYDRLRPWFLGGITVRTAYDMLQPVKDEIILDVGCGMGAALDYLSGFSEFHGFDTDQVALDAFKSKHGDKSNVTLYNQYVTQADVERINPHKVLMMGLLHHLDDDTVLGLLKALSASANLVRMVSIDVYYGPGMKHLTANLLASFDRGQYVRPPEKYAALVERAGLKVEKSVYLRSGNKLAAYYVMSIVKPSAA